jgi:hypothetical protein
MMIPKQAKICPHCRKRQGWSLIAKIFLGIFIFMLFGLIVNQSQKSKTPAPTGGTMHYTYPEALLTMGGKALKSKHPDWSNDICNTVSERKILLGMTKEQVLSAWGKPTHTNTETSPSLEQELWWYGDLAKGTILHFQNGKLAYVNENK